jgi:hypothetical protein
MCESNERKAERDLGRRVLGGQCCRPRRCDDAAGNARRMFGNAHVGNVGDDNSKIEHDLGCNLRIKSRYPMPKTLSYFISSSSSSTSTKSRHTRLWNDSSSTTKTNTKSKTEISPSVFHAYWCWLTLGKFPIPKALSRDVIARYQKGRYQPNQSGSSMMVHTTDLV